jgi:hypothetical protein
VPRDSCETAPIRARECNKEPSTIGVAKWAPNQQRVERVKGNDIYQMFTWYVSYALYVAEYNDRFLICDHANVSI